MPASSSTQPSTPAAATEVESAVSHLRRDSAHLPGSQAAVDPAVRLARLTGVQILATGSYVPPQVVSNQDLAADGYDPEWIVQRTGIHARRRAAKGLAASDLGYEAAVRCLEQAQVRPDELDLIVLATMTPDSPTPSTACQLQRRLGGHAAAFDVSAACAGFMYALVTGMQFIKTGSVRRVLVVGAEVMTRIIDPHDTKTFPLFGDGAGAVLLGAGSDEQGLVSYTLGADGSGADLLTVPGGGSREPLSAESIAAGRQYMRMDGRAVFKWAVNLLAKSIREVLAAADLTGDDIALVVLHQANRRILDAAAEHLGLDPAKLVVNLDRYGNTSAGTIPLALDEVYRSGRLQCGDRVLLSGFGAGLSWGTAVLRW